MPKLLTDEQISEIFAEGMEAANCGLLMKDGPKGTGRRWAAWRQGYLQAMRDRGDFPYDRPSARERIPHSG